MKIMAFTAKDVQALREKTGCGMMDCKKALVESDGDMDKAVDFLREKGLAAVAKKSSRIAAEGAVLTYTDEAANVSVVVEVNSETDFVAQNDTFKEFVLEVAKTVAAANPADVDALMDVAVADGQTVSDALKDKIYTIGENIKIRRFERYEGTVASYTHGGGRIGVLVKYDAGDIAANAAMKEAVRDVAMQIAAINPAYLDEASVPAEDFEKEKAIRIAQMKEDPKMANKPEAVLAKIVEGKMGKFYKENCLLDQDFVKDGGYTVSKYLDNVAKELGGTIKIISFVRFEKGEGLQKKEDNFADEVASMVK